MRMARHVVRLEDRGVWILRNLWACVHRATIRGHAAPIFFFFFFWRVRQRPTIIIIIIQLLLSGSNAVCVAHTSHTLQAAQLQSDGASTVPCYIIILLHCSTHHATRRAPCEQGFGYFALRVLFAHALVPGVYVPRAIYAHARVVRFATTPTKRVHPSHKYSFHINKKIITTRGWRPSNFHNLHFSSLR